MSADKLDDVARQLRAVVAGQKEVIATLLQPVVAQYDDEGRVTEARRQAVTKPATRNQHMSVTQREWKVIAKAMALAIKDYVDKQLGPIEQRLAELEAQVKALEDFVTTAPKAATTEHRVKNGSHQ